MELEFIGVGEAFEPQLGNASYLVHSKTKLLVDCGYAIPRNFFSKDYPADYIDGIYITHFHADHFFGLPPLLVRWKEDGRQKPLTIIGQPGTEKRITETLDLGYPGCRAKLQFELKYMETVEPYAFNELRLSFAPSDHSMKNLAICIATGGVAIGISGDGGLTDETRKLFQDCNILVHEAYRYDQMIEGHTNAMDIVKFAKTVPNLLTLALVHIQREERISQAEAFRNLKDDVPFNLMIPAPGDMVSVE